MHMGASAVRSRKIKKGLVLVREPSGRLSRSTEAELSACEPTAVRRLRDAALRGMASEEWGWEIGRLFLAGKVSAIEFEAGKRWGRLVHRYRSVIAGPKATPKSLAIGELTAARDADPDSEAGRLQAERDREIIAEMLGSHAALLGAGKLAEAAVRNVCEAHEAVIGYRELLSLRAGLKWLAEYWGLTGPTTGSRDGR